MFPREKWQNLYRAEYGKYLDKIDKVLRSLFETDTVGDNFLAWIQDINVSS